MRACPVRRWVAQAVRERLVRLLWRTDERWCEFYQSALHALHGTPDHPATQAELEAAEWDALVARLREDVRDS
ncbi:hypothetical protein ACWF94_38660 [Streptomyces sp. NPDC055078]